MVEAGRSADWQLCVTQSLPVLYFLSFSSIINPSFALCLVRVFLLQAQRFVGTAGTVFVDSRALVARMQFPGLAFTASMCVYVSEATLRSCVFVEQINVILVDSFPWDKGGSVWSRIVAQR